MSDRRSQVLAAVVDILEPLKKPCEVLEVILASVAWADANNHDAEIQFNLTKENKKLEARIAKLRSALEFFAGNANQWGSVAREALREDEKE